MSTNSNNDKSITAIPTNLSFQGQPIRKQSSFDRLMSALSTTPTTSPRMKNDKTLISIEDFEKLDKASVSIANWWKRIHKLCLLKDSMFKISKEAEIVVEMIDNFALLEKSNNFSFDYASELLSEAKFVASLSTLLRAFPKDPNMGSKNGIKSSESICKQQNMMGRSARFISSVIMIKYFPQYVLSSSSSENEESNNNGVDDSPEAKECFNGALSLIRSLRKLMKFISIFSTSLSAKKQLNKFQQVLLTYRLTARTFISSLESWKELDAQRMIQSLEFSYMQCYAIYIATSEEANVANINGETNNDKSSFIKTAELQCRKISQGMIQVLGESKAINRIEELSAQVEAAIAIEYKRTIESTLEDNNNSDSTKTLQSHNMASLIESFSATNMNDNEDTKYQKQRDEELRLLNRLAELSGVENERLAHEICLDATYRLPETKSPNEIEITSVTNNDDIVYSTTLGNREDVIRNPQEAADKMRNHMIRIMRDRMKCSLLISSISDLSQINLGSNIMIKYLDKEAPPNSVSFYLSARIIAITNDVGASINNNSTIDIKYICDGSVEKNASVSRIKLSTTPSDPEALVSAIEDLKNRITALIPKRPDLQSALLDMDLQLLRQMIQHNAITVTDMLNILNVLLSTLNSLQAPVRVESCTNWCLEFEAKCRSCISFQEMVVYLPCFFEFTAACIDELLRDMANYYISGLVPVMVKHGSSFLSSKFLNRLKDGQVTINQTYNMLLNQLSPLSNLKSCRADIEEAFGGASDSFNISKVFTDSGIESVVPIVARAFLQLIQSPVRLDGQAIQSQLPETLIWDGKRMALIRDLMDMISLELAVVVVVKQTLAQHHVRMSEDEEIELQRRLDILLNEPDIVLSNIITEATRSALDCFERVKGKFSTNNNANGKGEDIVKLEENMGKAVKNAVTENNPVLNLFTKRIFKVLLRALCGQPYLPKLPTYSLHGKGQEQNINKLIKMSVKLFRHHMNVNSFLYLKLFISDKAIKESIEEENNIDNK